MIIRETGLPKKENQSGLGGTTSAVPGEQGGEDCQLAGKTQV